jgi:hypothetical protein
MGWYIFRKGKSSLKLKTSEAILNLKYTKCFKGHALQGDQIKILYLYVGI